MALSDLLARRRMVRRYLPEPVEEESLERVLEAARRHPSAGFSQGIHFVVVTSREGRQALAELAGEPAYVARGFEPWLSEAPVHVILCASKADYEARYAEPDKSGVESWPVPYWYVDAGAAFMLLLLAAAEENLAAGFLGAHRLGGVQDLLGMPEGVHPVGLVTLGRPAPDRRSGSLRRGRRALAEIVHRERW